MIFLDQNYKTTDAIHLLLRTVSRAEHFLNAILREKASLMYGWYVVFKIYSTIPYFVCDGALKKLK
jgi:hypothetical protein